MYLHELALAMRVEAIQAKEDNEAYVCNLRAAVGIQYGLQVTGLRGELYKLDLKGLAYGKSVITTLEQSYSVAIADNLMETMRNLDSHFTTKLMEAVAILGPQNATKPAGGSNKGYATGEKYIKEVKGAKLLNAQVFRCLASTKLLGISLSVNLIQDLSHPCSLVCSKGRKSALGDNKNGRGPQVCLCGTSRKE